VTIDTSAGIDWFQMRTQLSALKLELLGLKHSGGSVYAHVKKAYGLKGTKARVYDQFAELVEAARPKAA